MWASCVEKVKVVGEETEGVLAPEGDKILLLPEESEGAEDAT